MKRYKNCLNCKYSYKDSEGNLRCNKNHMTSISQSYRCLDYKIFIKNKFEFMNEIWCIINNKRR